MQCFFILLFILIFSLYDMSAAFPPPGTLQTSGEDGTVVPVVNNENNDNNRNEKGYECGNIFYSESEVNKVLLMGLRYADQGHQHPQRYFGPMYKDSGSTEYLVWPIKKQNIIGADTKYPRTSHSVIFTKSGEKVIDVIAKIIDNDSTRCIRRYGSQAVPPISIPEDTNGYQCGSRFLSDEVIRKSNDQAQKMMKQQNDYPMPYDGRLYPADKGYLIWPILSRRTIFTTGNGWIRPYFLIIDSQGQFMDVVVKCYHKNFLRCIRSKKFPEVPASDPYKELFVPPPKAVYKCGNILYDIEVLNFAADLARNLYERRLDRRMPEKYDGHPFDEPCLLWPITNYGSLIKKGNRGPYRLVLDAKFVVKSVVIVSGANMELCDKKLIKGKKNHDKSDYLCRKSLFPNHILASAANIACKRLRAGAPGVFPAKYEGPSFEKDGPYHTYPIFRDRAFTYYRGPNRVVINSNCEVVGALTTIKNASEQRLIKCHRVDDGPSPSQWKSSPNERIVEHIVRHKSKILAL